MSKLRSRLPPSFSVTVGTYATARKSSRATVFLMVRVRVRRDALAPGEFFAGVRKGLKASLPEKLRRFEVGRGHSRLLKIHYGRPEVHFEAWHHTGDGRLEVGLHFEGTAQLPRAELEPWDRGWSRLYETLPALVLDEPAQSATLERMGAYITTLQPMVDGFLEERT